VSGRGDPVLVLDGLEKAYGEVRALDGCAFAVERGRMLGFLGPNGAGKTTTMRAIFGLVRLDAGSVTWDGRPVTDADRLRFGYMPEVRGLYPKMKARDQLVYLGMLHGLTRSDARRAADRWLETLGVGERAEDPVEELSHGNQQRVQLAASLVHEPELLVLDEPFSGLDPLGVETMAEVLRAQADAGTAVVFSSHQLDLVEDLCEDVAIIDRGRIVLAGNVRELKDASRYRRLELELEDGGEFLRRLTGIVAHEVDGDRHRLLVDKDTDVRELLAAASPTARIREFAYTTPSLNDLFREAVTR